MTTLTITRTPDGYVYGDTEHTNLWRALTAASAALWPTPTRGDVSWLYGVFASGRRGSGVWVNGTKVEVLA